MFSSLRSGLLHEQVPKTYVGMRMSQFDQHRQSYRNRKINDYLGLGKGKKRGLRSDTQAIGFLLGVMKVF